MELRSAVFQADLDTNVWSRQRHERVLVGHVVTQIQHSGCAYLSPQAVERVALRRFDNRNLSDHLSVTTRQLETIDELLCELVHLLRLFRAAPIVDRDARRFGLNTDSGPLCAELFGQPPHFGQRLGALDRQRPRKAQVELATMGADQSDLIGQASQKREVPQPSPRDHSDMSLTKLGQRSNRHHTFTCRPGIHRVGDDRRQRAIKIGRYQQHRRRSQLCELVQQARLPVPSHRKRGVQPSTSNASKNAVAQRLTS